MDKYAIFTLLWTNIAVPIDTASAQVVAALMARIGPWFKLCVGAYLLIMMLIASWSEDADAIQRLFRSLFLAAIVYAIAFNAGTFDYYVTQLVHGTTNAISTATTNIFNQGGAIDANAFDIIGTRSFAIGLAVFKNLPFNPLKSVTLGICVAIYWFVSYWAIVIMFSVYLVSYVLGAFVMAFGPLFIPLYFFPFTRKYFEGWLSTVLCTLLVQVFTAALAAMFIFVIGMILTLASTGLAGNQLATRRRRRGDWRNHDARRNCAVLLHLRHFGRRPGLRCGPHHRGRTCRTRQAAGTLLDAELGRWRDAAAPAANRPRRCHWWRHARTRWFRNSRPAVPRSCLQSHCHICAVEEPHAPPLYLPPCSDSARRLLGRRRDVCRTGQERADLGSQPRQMGRHHQRPDPWTDRQASGGQRWTGGSLKACPMTASGRSSRRPQARQEASERDRRRVNRLGYVVGISGMVGGLIALAAALTVVAKLPPVQPQKYVLVDKTSGAIVPATDAKDAPLLYPEATHRAEIRALIVACEGYVPQSWAKVDFHNCMIRLTPGEQKTPQPRHWR